MGPDFQIVVSSETFPFFSNLSRDIIPLLQLLRYESKDFKPRDSQKQQLSFSFSSGEVTILMPFIELAVLDASKDANALVLKLDTTVLRLDRRLGFINNMDSSRLGKFSPPLVVLAPGSRHRCARSKIEISIAKDTLSEGLQLERVMRYFADDGSSSRIVTIEQVYLELRFVEPEFRPELFSLISEPELRPEISSQISAVISKVL